MLKLFYTPGTCSLASHIALEEAGAAYEVHRVDFSKAEQTKPDYLSINPKGRVPALVTDRGILTETPAILAYIAQSFRRRGLRRLTILSSSRGFSRLSAISARLSTLPMPMRVAPGGGRMIRQHRRQ